jgi:hypothetical protein
VYVYVYSCRAFLKATYIAESILLLIINSVQQATYTPTDYHATISERLQIIVNLS